MPALFQPSEIAIGTATELVGFFNHSAKRTRILENAVASKQHHPTFASKTSKTFLCWARWVERQESLRN